MPQLQINQGPQDALLYDNSKSYFKQVGYSRTSNFQIEYRDVDPANTASLGSTVQFVMPKCADLMGTADLMIDFETLSKTVVDGLAHGQAGKAAYYGCSFFLSMEFPSSLTSSVICSKAAILIVSPSTSMEEGRPASSTRLLPLPGRGAGCVGGKPS